MAAKMGGAWRHAKSWFPSHMGKAMGVLRERYAGQMDFGKAAGLVKASLS